MPPYLTAAHSDGRCRLHRTRAIGAEPNGQCGRAARTSRRRSENPSLSLHAIYHRASVRPQDRPRTLAPQIFMLHVVAEGAGS
jgi:hypothetical protein